MDLNLARDAFLVVAREVAFSGLRIRNAKSKSTWGVERKENSRADAGI